MKYYTKELWAGINQRDRKRAEEAERQWCKNDRMYQKYLKRVRPQLTKSAKNFFGKVNLHDGALISFSTGDVIKRKKHFVSPKSFAEINVVESTGKYVYTLLYAELRKCLVDYHPDAPHSAGDYWTYDDWGYDEFSLTRDKWMRHEILFLSGATILLEFRRFSYRRERFEELQAKLTAHNH